MALDLIKNSVALSGEGESIVGEITVSETIRLSDNMSSIRKVLYSDEDILIRSNESFLGGIAIKGDIYSTVLYMGDNDKIDSVKAVLPFEYITDSTIQNSGAVVIKCAITRSEILPMKQRRMDINYVVSIKGFCTDEIDYAPLASIEGAEGMNYLREENQSTLIRTKLAEKELEHSFKIGQQRPGKIIYTGANLTELTSNTSPSGILINGMVNLSVIYTTYDEDDIAIYHTYNDSIALNQFIETDYGTSFSSFETLPYISMNDAVFITNEAGEVEVSASGSIVTNIVLIKEVFYPVVSDLFSTAYDISLSGEKVILSRLNDVRKVKSNVVASAGFKPSGINRIAAGKASANANLAVDSDAIGVYGEFKAQALILRSVAGEADTVDCKTDYAFDFDGNPDSRYFAHTMIDSITYDINGEDLVIRADLITYIFELEEEEAEQPVSASVAEYTAEDDNFVTVKVRFLSDADSLWAIAKENRVSIEQILAENNMETEQSIKANQPIVIRNY